MTNIICVTIILPLFSLFLLVFMGKKIRKSSEIAVSRLYSHDKREHGVFKSGVPYSAKSPEIKALHKKIRRKNYKF